MGLPCETRSSTRWKAARSCALSPDWEVTPLLMRALGTNMRYMHTSAIMDEVAATMSSFANVSYALPEKKGSVQRLCNEQHPLGMPGVVYMIFRHPVTQANVLTTDCSGWAANYPEYQVTTVRVLRANEPTARQEDCETLTDESRRVARDLDEVE